VSLEVTKDNVVVEVAEKYYLDLPLSYEVDEIHGAARFDKSKQVLELELPVIPKAPKIDPVLATHDAHALDDGGLSEGEGSDEDEVPQLADEHQVSARHIVPVDVEECDVVDDTAMSYYQNRQNIALVIDIPALHEVADVQLRLVGNRLTITFCVRPPLGGPDFGQSQSLGNEPARSTGAKWKLRQLRRVLCGLVDPRQWHAELAVGSTTQLVIVIRKADQKELWPEVFDTISDDFREPHVGAMTSEDGVAEMCPAYENEADGTQTTTDGAACVRHSEVRNTVTNGLPCTYVGTAEVDDSAELDAAAPLVHVSDVEKGAPQTSSEARVQPPNTGMIQSASVMGQSVLLRNRLMYQLL